MAIVLYVCVLGGVCDGQALRNSDMFLNSSVSICIRTFAITD